MRDVLRSAPLFSLDNFPESKVVLIMVATMTNNNFALLDLDSLEGEIVQFLRPKPEGFIADVVTIRAGLNFRKFPNTRVMKIEISDTLQSLVKHGYLDSFQNEMTEPLQPFFTISKSYRRWIS